jgi:hypothetical protein
MALEAHKRLLRKKTSVSPGEIRKKDFFRPMGITQYRLAREISEIVVGRRSVKADMDLLLYRFFGKGYIGGEPKTPMMRRSPRGRSPSL